MPPTLGQRLKHAREKRGLALEDVAHKTKIPVARLRDLEEDRLNSFGGMTYAKSFLRSYATLLGVNADEVLGQMRPPPLGGVRDYRYLVESHGPWVGEKADRLVGPPIVPAVGQGKSFLFAALVCLVFGLLVGGGVLASAYFGSKEHATAKPGADYLSADASDEEQEFSVFGVSLTIVPDRMSTPKAQGVGEPGTRATTPLKAEPVR